MKQIILLIISLSLPGLFQAATFPSIIEKGDPRPIVSIKKNTTTSLESMRTKIQKQHGFFRQVALLRKVKRSSHTEGSYLQSIDPGDKKAKQSLWVGIIALLFAMIPWYTIFAAIPLGIVALTMGNQAKQMGSKKMNGKGFGIAALAVVALWFILVALFVAAFTLSWGGIFAG